MVRHFHRAGTRWQVSDQLRSMVRTQRINLATPLPPLPVFDVVFLRNVLIYFDAPTKKAILQRVRQVLSPRGFLFLGGAETTLGIDESWTRATVGRFTLYRPQPGHSAPAPAFTSTLAADAAKLRSSLPPVSSPRWATTASEGR
jgi:chemotaxis protein methyltransferase CheR